MNHRDLRICLARPSTCWLKPFRALLKEVPDWAGSAQRLSETTGSKVGLGLQIKANRDPLTTGIDRPFLSPFQFQSLFDRKKLSLTHFYLRFNLSTATERGIFGIDTFNGSCSCSLSHSRLHSSISVPIDISSCSGDLIPKDWRRWWVEAQREKGDARHCSWLKISFQIWGHRCHPWEQTLCGDSHASSSFARNTSWIAPTIHSSQRLVGWFRIFRTKIKIEGFIQIPLFRPNVADRLFSRVLSSDVSSTSSRYAIFSVRFTYLKSFSQESYYNGDTNISF
jgi:hypothetical protein